MQLVGVFIYVSNWGTGTTYAQLDELGKIIRLRNRIVLTVKLAKSLILRVFVTLVETSGGKKN